MSVGNSLEKVSGDMKRDSVLISWHSKLMEKIVFKEYCFVFRWEKVGHGETLMGRIQFRKERPNT